MELVHPSNSSLLLYWLHFELCKEKWSAWYGWQLPLEKSLWTGSMKFYDCFNLGHSQSPHPKRSVLPEKGRKEPWTEKKKKIRVVLMSICPIRHRSRALAFSGQGPIKKTAFKRGSSIRGNLIQGVVTRFGEGLNSQMRWWDGEPSQRSARVGCAQHTSG